MALDRDHLEYPLRRYGMDHERYDWSMLTDRKPVKWPGDARLALWVNVSLQHFPLNQKKDQVGVPGGMTMPYPDLRHYSLRDYGNRVGIYRVLQALDKYGVKPTFAINTRLAERIPYLLEKVCERGDEIICHGWQMDHIHYGGMPLEAERELVQRSVSRLRELSGQAVRGWLSPAQNQSENTPELLAEAGIEYHCDWVNDDMPYEFRTDAGNLIALPLSNELNDRFILQSNLHSEESYAEQIEDACDFLLSEAAEQGGRVLALSIHPWMLGQPHRIGQLERVLKHITSQDGVWSAGASEILNAWRNQQS